MNTPIQTLNDALRAALPTPGKLGNLVVSEEVSELSFDEQMLIIAKVRTFDAFTQDNDPHQEHDYGSVEHEGDTYYWKIDYYDTKLERLSPNASDPTLTTRVITVMTANDM